MGNNIRALFRFYESLNDFLPKERKKISFQHFFPSTSSIKDIIESLGVPHTEIDLILVNGQSVNFYQQLKEGDYVSVYPVFELFDINDKIKLRPKPLRESHFILDVHLGKLARHLRLLGFDTIYEANYDDDDVIKIASQQKRMILTRDIGLLKRKQVSYGYWLRETNPNAQIKEIINKFDLSKKAQPFTRCLSCNGEIHQLIDPSIVSNNIPDGIKSWQHDFYQCLTCQRIYWHGTHYEKLKSLVDKLLESQ